MMKPIVMAEKTVPSRTPSRCPNNDNAKITPMLTMVMSKNGFTLPQSLFKTSPIATTAPSPGSIVMSDLTSMTRPNARTKQLMMHKIH